MPKGVPLRRGERHLAVHVEDHPLEYADFEGTIPAGEYGAGTVEIWDRGTYELLEEKRDGGLTVRLHGERLDGVWTLVPAHLDGDPKNWLLLRKDAGASAARPVLGRCSRVAPTRCPTGEGWVYEPKWDGFRAIVTVVGRRRDVHEPERQRPHRAVRGRRARGCARDPLVRRGARRRDLRARRGGPLALLAAPGGSRHGVPRRSSTCSSSTSRAARRPATRGAAEAARGARRPQRGRSSSRRSSTTAQALLAAAREQELEGVVAKLIDSRYRPGRRSPDWHKLKLRQTQEVVVAGYTRGQGRRSGGFGALVARGPRSGRAPLGGNVGTGFTDGEIERLLGLLRPLERPDSPFAEVPKMPRIRRGDVIWVEPRSSPRSSSRSGRTKDGCARPSTSACARTRRPRRCGASACPLQPVAEARPARAAPLEPRQAVLAGGRDHEGRPHRLLPRRRGGARPAPARPAVHDEALPRRLAGQELLPEARAVPHARVDPASAVSRLDARGREEGHRLRPRERRARAAVDGEHGLHRPAHVGVARRQARAARLGDVRPRPVRGRRGSRR